MDPLLHSILEFATSAGASDIHLSAGEKVYFRVNGQLQGHEDYSTPLESEWLDRIGVELLSDHQSQLLSQRGSADGAFTWQSFRFRFNAYRRSGETCFALRKLADQIPTLNQLGIDSKLYDVCGLKDGLILVAGPTGSGKSTTIASLISRINQTRSSHIVTIEDPVEFLHPSDQSLVNQRQVGPDVGSFHQALLDAMRQDPDVILVGELRDLETVRTAISAAETGHLVFATVHAGDTKTAIERLVAAYSAEEQNLAQRLVATVLRTVVVQHLLPMQRKPDGYSGPGKAEPSDPAGSAVATDASANSEPSDATDSIRRQRVLATERVHVTPGIANLIAGGNLNQLVSIVQTSSEEGMWTLDESLARLLRQGLISETTARSLARQPELLSQLARVRRL